MVLEAPAQAIEFAGCGCAMMTPPAAKKRSDLKQAVIPYVQQAASQAQGGPCAADGIGSDQREAQAHEDDADVFDAVIGQQCA